MGKRTITPELLREAQRLISNGLSQRETAKQLHISQSGLCQRLRTPETPHPPKRSKPGVTINGDDATVVSDPAPDLSDIDTLLRARKLNPADWEVTSVVVNEWDGYEGPMRQLKIHCKRKLASILASPASEVPQRPRPRYRSGGVSRLVALCGDQHAPYHDPGLHSAFLSWLHDAKPDEVVLLGDGGDFPTISRHRDNPAWSASPQECVQAMYEVYAAYRDAAPHARFHALKGNHDIRLETELLNRAERMYGIKPAAINGEEQQALSLRRLVHLDRLHIDLVESGNGDNYEHAQVKVSEYLGARHGWLTGEKGVERTLERLGHSVVVGHTHHQRMTKRSLWDIDRKPRVVVGVEAGCMCQIEGGLGYSVNPNWQAGFATAQVWSDGTFKIDLAAWIDGRLYWRDKRYGRRS